MAPECIFQPRLLDLEDEGVAVQVFNAINAADIDLRKDLYNSIVLSGGSTMFPGYPTRLQKELENIYDKRILKLSPEEASKSRPRTVPITIEDPPRRKYFVFSGGSVLAGVGKDSPNFWVSKKDYDEKGADALVL